MLDRAGDEVTAARGFERLGYAPDGEVVRFGSARGEHDFGRFGVHQRCHRGSGLVKHRLGLLAEMMHRRSVTEQIASHLGDFVNHFRRRRCRGVVIEVDTHRELFIVALALSVGSKRTRQP